MLLVKASVGPSKIQGLGIIARAFIPKGTVVWRFTPRFDMIFDKDSIALLTEIQRDTVLHHTYLNKKTKKYTLCCDDARFFNHSENPNTICVDTDNDEEGLDVAARDI